MKYLGSTKLTGAILSVTLFFAQNLIAQHNQITTTDGVDLYYKDWGKGDPIVFLHSWGVTSDIWQYQMNYLGNLGHRCIAFDRRGHGRSGQPWSGYDYDTLASDLNTIIESLKLRDVTLVSHSMAGGEIIRYLSKYGQGKISRVVITSTNLPFMQKTEDNPDGVNKEIIEHFHANLQTDTNSTIRAGVNSFFGEDLTVSKDMVEWGISLFGQTSLRALLECNKSNMLTDFRQELAEVTLPVLLIHGGEDASAPIHLTAERCKKLIPNAKLKVYPNGPHGIILTHKEEMAKDILSFVQEIDR